MALDYLDFWYNGQKLSDLGGLVAGPSGWNPLSVIPSMDRKSEKVLGRDGAIFYSASFNARSFTVPITFDDITDLSDIRNVAIWLGSKVPTDFYFVDDTVKIKCMVDTLVDWQHYDATGTFDLKLIAYDPYYYLVTDDIFVFTGAQLAAGQAITVQGNVDAYPLITLGAYSFPIVTFGSQSFFMNGSGTGAIIDTYNKTAQDLSGNNIVTQVSSGVFPKLTPGINNLLYTNSGTSSLVSMTIATRARYI